MSNATYFDQECPTCGRRLHIRVEYLGRQVVCQHCRGTLVALDVSSKRSSQVQPAYDLIRRADELLEQVGDQTLNMPLGRQSL